MPPPTSTVRGGPGRRSRSRVRTGAASSRASGSPSISAGSKPRGGEVLRRGGRPGDRRGNEAVSDDGLRHGRREPRHHRTDVAVRQREHELTADTAIARRRPPTHRPRRRRGVVAQDRGWTGTGAQRSAAGAAARAGEREQGIEHGPTLRTRYDTTASELCIGADYCENTLRGRHRHNEKGRPPHARLHRAGHGPQ